MLPSLDLTQCLESSCVNMFLINASCMRAKWEKPFPRGGTQWRPFASSDGPSGLQTVQAEMMHITGNFPYFEDADLQVQYLEIAYVNREASLCVVLPKASKKKNLLLDLEKKLSYDSIIKLSTQKRLRTVNVFLPKFKVENTFDLKDLFMRTSMKSAFHEEADYSNMVESSEFHLAGAFHKSSIGK
jgi:serpin B